MGQKSSARPPDGKILKTAGEIRKPDGAALSAANGILRPDDRIRKPDAGILKKEVLGYTGICLVLLLFLVAGRMLVRTFPARAFADAFLYLAVGGLSVSAWIFRFCRRAEQSEFFKTFCWLYHPGIWILAAATFLEESSMFPDPLAGNLHLLHIAGGTFLVAGVIVLVVILREGKT